jgi:hypothetical protein
VRHFRDAKSRLAKADVLSGRNLGKDVGEELLNGERIASSGHTVSPSTASKSTESVTMATFQLPTRRLILAGGFAVAVAAAPAITAISVPTEVTSEPIAACVAGESQDTFTNVCVPDLVPNSPEGFTTTAANPDVPEIDGIPCIGHGSAACVGLAEDQQAEGPPAVPRSTVSSSPTVTGYTGP